jgi:hypothetical protein
MTLDRFHLDGPAPACVSGLGISGGFVLEEGMDVFKYLPYDYQVTAWQVKARNFSDGERTLDVFIYCFSFD